MTLRYRNCPRPARHPAAPCDERGRPLEVLRLAQGVAAVRRPGSREVLLAELDPAEGVARRIRPADPAELDRLLDDLEAS